jgi:hypothetical protein
MRGLIFALCAVAVAITLHAAAVSARELAPAHHHHRRCLFGCTNGLR